MNNNKPLVLMLGVIGALLAISLLVRFVVLSEFGLSGGSIFYLGFPIGGLIALALLLMRLGLLNFGGRSSATFQGLQQHSPAQGPALVSPSSSPAPTSQRPQGLETLRANGTISDAEYAEERARIISDV